MRFLSRTMAHDGDEGGSPLCFNREIFLACTATLITGFLSRLPNQGAEMTPSSNFIAALLPSRMSQSLMEIRWTETFAVFVISFFVRTCV